MKDQEEDQQPAAASPLLESGDQQSSTFLALSTSASLQGRGGFLLGTVIVVLFHLLQLYRNLRRPSEVQSRSSDPPANSAQASAIVESPDSPYYVGLKKCLDDPYHPICNPDGVIDLGSGQNQLMLDLVRAWIEKNSRESLRGWMDGGPFLRATYQPFDRLEDLKIAVAVFIRDATCGLVRLHPSDIILVSGATSAIETLCFCLADPGNAVLVPSPYDPRFDDIKSRTNIELIPVASQSTDSFFTLSIAALERAYNQANRRGIKVCAVLVSNPSNPVGSLLSDETLASLLHFVTVKNIHLISDERYAGFQGNTEFRSMVNVASASERSRVHVLYSLSEDLSLPGFSMGVLHSYNINVLHVARKLERLSPISAPTQYLLESMLSDSQFRTHYFKINNERLCRMYDSFVREMGRLGISCTLRSGVFYCWANMSSFIPSYSERGEMELWDKLLNVAKINVTPGSLCHCIEPGWFRFCFGTLRESDIRKVMSRIRLVLEAT